LTERAAATRVAGQSRDPIGSFFLDLGEHTVDKALLLLTDAIHAEHQHVSAYEWLLNALPGATLKPAFAFGTVGELYRSFSRSAEFARLSALRRN